MKGLNFIISKRERVQEPLGITAFLKLAGSTYISWIVMTICRSKHLNCLSQISRILMLFADACTRRILALVLQSFLMVLIKSRCMKKTDTIYLEIILHKTF